MPTTIAINFFAAPDRFSFSRSPAEYSVCIDQSGRIVHVSDSWDTFAPIIFPRRDVLGRSIECFMSDETVRDCFLILFERIRSYDRTARMVTRCDHAATPRAMQVALVPFPGGKIEISWTLIGGHLAEEVRPVARRLFYDREFLRMCSWCRDVHMPAGWQRIEAAAPALGLLDHNTSLPPITHGICPTCNAAVAAENPGRGLSIAV